MSQGKRLTQQQKSMANVLARRGYTQREIARRILVSRSCVRNNWLQIIKEKA